MTGREPAAFNFIDLTQCGDDDNIGSTSSAAPAATMALLTPKVQPEDDEAKRAMPPPPARGPGQAHMLLQGSTSTANYYNNNNRGVVFHGPGQTFLRPDLAFLRPDQSFLRPDQTFFRQDEGISNDHCRAYLDRQDGGRSAARQRRRLERQPTQPAPDHNSVQNNTAITHPTDVVHDQVTPAPTQPAPDHNSVQNNNTAITQIPTDVVHDQVKPGPTQPAPDHNSVQNNNIAITHPTDVVHDQVKPAQTQIQLGNHLTLASTSKQQLALEFDRLKWERKEERRRQKNLMAIKEQEQAALSQQCQAAMFLASQRQQGAAAGVMNLGGHYNVHMQNPHYGQAPPPPPLLHPGLIRPLLPRPPLLMPYNPMATSINNMRPGSATVIPGSLNWMAQQRQQHFPAPNLMSNEGNRSMAMHHCGVTAQLTIFYASMVGVFEDVSCELAQSICMLLDGKESKLWPPTLIRHPQNHVSQPTLIPPQSTAPSVPQSSHQAGPSQAAPSGKLPQARKSSLARFLEKRKDRIRSKGNVVKEEVDTPAAIIPDNPHGKSITTLAEPHPSLISSAADQKVVLGTHVTSDPTTPPGTSSLSKRKFAPDHDLYVRRQSTGEYVSVDEDVTIPRTATEYVMREYHAVLKDLDP